MSSIPFEISTFVGRREAVAEIKSILSESRLVTLTGTGGVGKTRLAAEAARRIAGSYPDGVCFVSLADIVSPEMVPISVIRELGVSTQQDDVLAAIVDHLRSRRVLLVLDNCEHVVDAAARLASALVAACRGLRILTTSREPLRVGGEFIYPVPPLQTPDGTSMSPSAVDSVVLFMERARAVSPGFALTQDNQDSVLKLCDSLDGLPLAIELAAVRVGTLPINELVAGSGGKYALLSRGSRVAAPRHQTLRAAVDWSYDLCSNVEQEVWIRLSAFAGGFDVDSASAVCADLALEAHELIDVVGRLAEKSIVSHWTIEGGLRYSMLQTIREYGREKLRAHGLDLVVRGAHMRHLLALAAEVDADWFGNRQRELFSRVRQEQPNVRAALEFSLNGGGDTLNGLRLAADLWPFWFATGQQRESRHWIDLLLDRNGEPSRERAKALWVSGFFAILTGDREAAQGLLAQCAGCAALVHANDLLAQAAYAEGLLALAGRGISADGAIPGDELDPDQPGSAAFRVLGTIDLGYAHCLAGDLDRAAELFQRCRSECEAHEEFLLHSFSLMFQGLVEILRQRPESALEVLRQSLRVKRDYHDLLGMGLTLEFLAWAHAVAGEHRDAAVLFGVGERFWGPVGTYLVGFEKLVEWHELHARLTRSALGDAEYEDLFRQGDSLGRAEAISRGLGEAPEPHRSSASKRVGSLLTRREEQIARLISEGKSNREIAESLVISVRTVNTHVEHILRKLGVNSRTRVAAWIAGLPVSRSSQS